MLFPDIKSYFIEQESNAGESYINDLEATNSIEEMIQVVADYNGTDDFEAAYYILNNVCKL